jgi:hypothetical protein
MKTNLLAYSFFVFIILNSCAPAYVPSVVNIPLLTNKGEVQAAVYAGTSGVDPQLTYAFSNHVGVMLNGSFANNTSSTTNNYHKHQFGEIGAGYYTHFLQRGKFETFAGAGSGKLSAEFDNNLWISRSNVNYTRIFVQPAVGFTTKIFDLGFSTRFVFLKLHQELESNTGIFAEPVINVKFGYDHIKAVAQLGLSLPMNSGNIDFTYQPLLFSLGLQANFGKVFK